MNWLQMNNRQVLKQLSGVVHKGLKRFASDRGITLPIVLVMLLIGALLIIPTMDLLSTGLKSNIIADEADMSLYAADAGIEKALWHIQYDSGFALPEEGESVSVDFTDDANGNTVIVSILNEGILGYKVTSVAANDISRTSTTIITYVTITQTPTSSIFDYAAASLNGNVDITGAVHVFSDPPGEGDIFANLGDVNISGSSHIEGNAAATGVVNSTGAAAVDGQQIEAAAALDADLFRAELDSITAEIFTSVTDISCPFVLTTGDWVISSSGIYSDLPRIQGNLKIIGDISVTFPHAVCIEGNLEVPANAVIVFSDKVSVGGDVILSGANGIITFQNTLYVGDDLVVSGTSELVMEEDAYIVDQIQMTGSGLRGGATLIAGGDITLAGSGKLNDVTDIPFIISENGNVDFAGSNVISAIVCAPHGEVDLSGNVAIYGSVIGDSVVQILGSVEIEYPADLTDRDDLPQSGADETSRMTVTSHSITRSGG